ncbi:MAG: ABC transporter substrate-binding protein [Acidimicrobiia bacterium]
MKRQPSDLDPDLRPGDPGPAPRGSRSARRRRAWLAVALAGGLFAAACGSDGDSGSDPAGSSGSSSTEAPEVGADEVDADATVRAAFSAPTRTLDPHTSDFPSDPLYNSPVFDRLTRMAPDGNSVEPMLATEWTFVDDGKALELKLRDDVTFHDGEAMDAAAVKASIERAKTLPGSTAAPKLASITAVEVVDDHTVRLVLDGSGGAELPVTLTGNAGVVMSPAAVASGRPLDQDPGDAGSGPYRVVDFKPNEQVVYERVDPYWDDSEIRAKRLEISFIADAAARINGVRAGQLDIAFIAGPQVANAVGMVDRGEIQGLLVTARVANTIMLNTTRAPLDDVDIRRAVNFALDRAAISEGLYEGTCEPMLQPYEEGNWAHVEAIDELYPSDVEEARRLVEASGVADPGFELEVGAAGASQPLAEAAKEMLEQVGISVTVKPVPAIEVFPRFAAGESQAVVLGIVPGGDPNTIVADFIVGGLKLARGDDPGTRRVAELARAGVDPTLSQDERAEVYDELLTIVSEEAWYAPVCRAQYLFAHSDALVGADSGMYGAWTGVPDFSNLGIRA